MPEWDNDDDDDYQGSDLVKQLRAQLKDFKKKNTELDTELSTLRPQVRKASIASVLSDLGVPTKIAALLPSDVEPTKDAVKAWVDEYGDVFNLSPASKSVAEEKPAEEKPKEEEAIPTWGTPTIDQANQDMWAKIQSGEAAAGTTSPDIQTQQLAQLGRAFEAANGSADAYFEFLRSGKPLP